MQTVPDSYSAAERERLILEHLPQVRWIAASIHERLPASVAQEDLFSVGIIGLIHAVDHFDATKNASLRTYAEFRIRGAILDSLRGLDGIPVHKRKRTRAVQEAIAALAQRLGRSPAEDEIASELGISTREYQQWLSDLQGVTLGSLDTFASEGTDNGLISYLADPRQEDPGVAVERAELHSLLVQGIACMPENERTIL